MEEEGQKYWLYFVVSSSVYHPCQTQLFQLVLSSSIDFAVFDSLHRMEFYYCWYSSQESSGVKEISKYDLVFNNVLNLLVNNPIGNKRLASTFINQHENNARE